MPAIDRKPRRRLHSSRTPDFATEVEAREAAATVRALPEGSPEREHAWQALRPRLERWVQRICRTSITPEHAGALARIYITRPNLLSLLPPPGLR